MRRCRRSRGIDTTLFFNVISIPYHAHEYRTAVLSKLYVDSREKEKGNGDAQLCALGENPRCKNGEKNKIKEP